VRGRGKGKKGRGRQEGKAGSVELLGRCVEIRGPVGVGVGVEGRGRDVEGRGKQSGRKNAPLASLLSAPAPGRRPEGREEGGHQAATVGAVVEETCR
jgi:hypothetical protein